MNRKNLCLTKTALNSADGIFIWPRAICTISVFSKRAGAARLKLMKDFGLTCVQTYVPWNLHEPKEGQFDFRTT